MLRRSRLDNGIRIVTDEMPGVLSVSVGIWVENGSRYESQAQGGLSHFLEHMLFKGTATRSASQIAEEIDAVGGVLNAFTGKETTCYYARVLAEHLPIATSVLADIFLNSTFEDEEIERERSVVLQEISQVEDTPDDYIHDFFNLKYWPDHPLSYPVLGTTGTVGSFKRRDFLELVANRYCPDRIVIAAAGNLTHDEVEAWVARDFSGLSGSAPLDAGTIPQPMRGLFLEEKDLEQVHICLGTVGVSETAPERYAASVLNTAFGGGMSSRLFQEIREKRGRAYSVHSFLSPFRDSGYVGVYVGTSPEWVTEVCEIISKEMRNLALTGLTNDELARSKNQLKGGMLLGLETSDARMSRAARTEMLFGSDFPIAEVARLIDATTNDQVIEVATKMIAPEAVAGAVLGDLSGHPIDESILPAA